MRTSSNRCIPGALSNLVNHFPPATFAAKPVGVVGYSLGRLGGANVTIQLREYLNELAMICLPVVVCVDNRQQKKKHNIQKHQQAF